MKTIYKFGAASLLSTTLLASTAIAGSLEDPVVETVATPVYEPAFVGGDWTGAYGGLNLGYADVETSAGLDGDDMSYGLHIGYDYDFGQYVLGAELEYDKLDTELGDNAAEVDSVTRLKLRGGYDFGRTLVYATAGAARVETSVGDDTGEFIGLGVAYKVTESFTVGGELLEHRFDELGNSGIEADATTFNLRGSFRF